jgi:hypothetical protein
MIALPPVLAGAAQSTVADASPADAVTPMGAPGAVGEPLKVKLAFVVVVVPAVTIIDDTVWIAYEDDVIPSHVGSTSTEYVPAANPDIVYVPPESVVALTAVVSSALSAKRHTPATPAPLYLTVPEIEPPSGKVKLEVVVVLAVTDIDETVWIAYEDDVVPMHVGSASTEYVPAASPGIVYVPPGPVVTLPSLVLPALSAKTHTPATPVPL